jgi:hypothetical protein
MVPAPEASLWIMRYELTKGEWDVIKPVLPNKPRGLPRVDDRRSLNGIFWVLRILGAAKLAAIRLWLRVYEFTAQLNLRAAQLHASGSGAGRGGRPIRKPSGKGSSGSSTN